MGLDPTQGLPERLTLPVISVRLRENEATSREGFVPSFSSPTLTTQTHSPSLNSLCSCDPISGGARLDLGTLLLQSHEPLSN